MPRRVPVALSALFVSACSGPSQATAPSTEAVQREGAPSSVGVSSEPVPRPGGYVVVKAEAKLYTAPDESVTGRGMVYEGNPAVGSHLTYMAGPARVWRLVREQGDFVELETVSLEEAGAHCAWPETPLEGLEVRMWAKRDALARVITTPTKVEFSDGSSVELAAGVPVTCGHGDYAGSCVPDALGVRVRAPVEEALDTEYMPGSSFEPPEAIGYLADGARYGDEMERIFYDGKHHVQEREALFGVDGPARTAVSAWEQQDGETFVTVANRCVRVRARLDPRVGWAPQTGEALDRARVDPRCIEYQHLGPWDMLLDKFAVASVDAGADVMWRDGSSAGKTRSRLVFIRAKDEPENLKCGTVGGLDWCFDPSVVTDVETDPSEGRRPAGCSRGAI